MNNLEASKSSVEEGFVSELISRAAYYDTDDQDDGEDSVNGLDDPSSKKRRLNDDERLQRCRERNRVHARNTRERKRAQMDLMQQRIQELSDEKNRLEHYEPEVSVASILMSLSSNQVAEPKVENNMDGSRTFAADTIERIKSQISATLSDDEELEINSEILGKNKTDCTNAELEMIRRERNRMHAKKTRLRKKKMLGEMETIIDGLEQDIQALRQKHCLGPEESVSGNTESPRLASSMTIGTGGAGGVSKFTGFRHVHRSDSMVSGKVTSSAVRKESTNTPAAAPASAASRAQAFPPSLFLPSMGMSLGMGMTVAEQLARGMGMTLDATYLQALVAHALPAMNGGDQGQHGRPGDAAGPGPGGGAGSGSGSQGSTSHGGSSRGTSRNGSSGDLTTYYAPSTENIKFAGSVKQEEEEQGDDGGRAAPTGAQANKKKSDSNMTQGPAGGSSARGLNSGNTSRCNSSDSDESQHTAPRSPHSPLAVPHVHP